MMCAERTVTRCFFPWLEVGLKSSPSASLAHLASLSECPVPAPE